MIDQSADKWRLDIVALGIAIIELHALDICKLIVVFLKIHRVGDLRGGICTAKPNNRTHYIMSAMLR